MDILPQANTLSTFRTAVDNPVTYHADGNGYVADVTYSGNAVVVEPEANRGVNSPTRNLFIYTDFIE